MELRASRTLMAIACLIVFSSALHANTCSRVSDSAVQSAPATRLEFEAASVRQDNSDEQEQASIPLSADDSYPTGISLLRADFTLDTYITFAYKLWETPNLRHDLLAGQPKWVGEQRFRIEARIPPNSTKDQVRLMMQSLLADRFGLRVHTENREAPVLALVPVKAGALGPKLIHHEDGPPCSSQEPTSDIFPSVCDATQMKSDGPLALVGARNVTLDKLASFLTTYGYLNGEFGRDVVDQTGLQGRYDYTIRFARNTQADDAAKDTGVSLVTALREQLGMKLIAKRATVQRLIIDHIEPPSDN